MNIASGAVLFAIMIRPVNIYFVNVLFGKSLFNITNMSLLRKVLLPINPPDKSTPALPLVAVVSLV